MGQPDTSTRLQVECLRCNCSKVLHDKGPRIDVPDRACHCRHVPGRLGYRQSGRWDRRHGPWTRYRVEPPGRKTWLCSKYPQSDSHSPDQDGSMVTIKHSSLSVGVKSLTAIDQPSGLVLRVSMNLVMEFAPLLVFHSRIRLSVPVPSTRHSHEHTIGVGLLHKAFMTVHSTHLGLTSATACSSKGCIDDTSVDAYLR